MGLAGTILAPACGLRSGDLCEAVTSPYEVVEHTHDVVPRTKGECHGRARHTRHMRRRSRRFARPRSREHPPLLLRLPGVARRWRAAGISRGIRLGRPPDCDLMEGP